LKNIEAHHWFCDFLNEAAILFNFMVQIFDLKYFIKAQQAASTSKMLIFSNPDSWRRFYL